MGSATRFTPHTQHNTDNNHESRTLRPQRQGRHRHRRQWRHRARHGPRTGRRRAPRSRSSAATRRSRRPRSPSSTQGGAKAISVAADVTDKAAVAAMIERVAARTRPHRHPRQQCRHQHPQAAARARHRRVEQRDRDQPHQRLPVLAGRLSGDEGAPAAARSSTSAR